MIKKEIDHVRQCVLHIALDMKDEMDRKSIGELKEVAHRCDELYSNPCRSMRMAAEIVKAICTVLISEKTQ